MQCPIVEADLRQMHVGARYKGYGCAVCAVNLCLLHPEYLWNVTRTLYPEVADLLDIDPGCVEPNIRYLVARCWRSNPEYLSQIAGYPLMHPPTCREFIEILVNHAAACVMAK